MVKALPSSAGGACLISDGGTKIPHMPGGMAKRKSRYPELRKEFHSNKGVEYNTSYDYDLEIKYGRQTIILGNLVILNFLTLIP